MKKLVLVGFFAVVTAIAFNACKKSSDPAPTNNNGGTPADPCKTRTYDNTISAIISGNCTSTCHKPGVGVNNAENINLTSYANVKAYAQNGTLLVRINGGNSSNPVMPPTGKMADTTVAKFDCWKTNSFPQ